MGGGEIKPITTSSVLQMIFISQITWLPFGLANRPDSLTKYNFKNGI